MTLDGAMNDALGKSTYPVLDVCQHLSHNAVYVICKKSTASG